jgi:hypothetical protein
VELCTLPSGIFAPQRVECFEKLNARLSWLILSPKKKKKSLKKST